MLLTDVGVDGNGPVLLPLNHFQLPFDRGCLKWACYFYILTPTWAEVYEKILLDVVKKTHGS
jgi:hypothetical protein